MYLLPLWEYKYSVCVYMQNKLHLLTNMKMSIMCQWNILLFFLLQSNDCKGKKMGLFPWGNIIQ